MFFCLVFWLVCSVGFFFFQAEDGIRDYKVTGVQTCALRSKAGNPVLATGENRTSSVALLTCCGVLDRPLVRTMTAHDPGVSRQFVVDRSNDGVDRLYRVVSGGSL